MTASDVRARAPRPPRITEVDALRGFALLGILLVNALMMAGPYGVGSVADPDASTLDRTVYGVVQALVVGKFYLMFSFLFGYSFTLQLAAADRDDARPVPRLLRRSLGLLVLGALHAVLLYVGDILMTYALLGLVLIAVRDRRASTALRAARIVYVCVSGVLLLLSLLSLLVPEAEAAKLDAELSAGFAERVADYRGDAASVVRANLALLPEALLSVLAMGGFVLTAFLVGLYCGKLRLLAYTEGHRARMRRLCVLGAVLGLPGGLFMVLATNGPLGARWAILGEIVGLVTAPALTASYVCGLLLFLRSARGARVTALLAPAGRMALTNYLGQSLVMALVFTAYGLALYDRLDPAVVVLGAFLLYAAQLALSARLMARFRYGPVEWLLRAVTLAGPPHAPARARTTTTR
ncbi:DUF418 domain-containing protein [Streptomyces sp. NPDC048606]|uniref:DUF418 domain-containing protein n=1 Tax=Streptomyces sp. NPDC048606 TaxID=3154726 RepID=UPI003421B5A1